MPFIWSSLGDCTSGLVAGLVNNGMGAFYWSSLGDCTSGLVAGLVNTGTVPFIEDLSETVQVVW